MEQRNNQEIRFMPIMVAIFIGSFLCILASSTINIALEILKDHFQTSLDTITWTLTGFMLAMGTTAPIVGYLGEVQLQTVILVFLDRLYAILGSVRGRVGRNLADRVPRAARSLQRSYYSGDDGSYLSDHSERKASDGDGAMGAGFDDGAGVRPDAQRLAAAKLRLAMAVPYERADRPDRNLVRRGIYSLLSAERA